MKQAEYLGVGVSPLAQKLLNSISKMLEIVWINLRAIENNLKFMQNYWSLLARGYHRCDEWSQNLPSLPSHRLLRPGRQPSSPSRQELGTARVSLFFIPVKLSEVSCMCILFMLQVEKFHRKNAHQQKFTSKSNT